MDGATAWHLIYRHADDWNETGEMMNAWLRANVAAERERIAERVREEAKHWQAEGQKDTRDFEICALLIERSNVELNGAPLAARPSDRRERFECDVREQHLLTSVVVLLGAYAEQKGGCPTK